MAKILAILLVICTSLLLAAAQGFNIKLKVQNGQVAELHFGCKDGCTANYDSKEDIMVPMMTMSDSGIVGLIIPNRANEYLYQDMRSISLPQSWSLQCIIKNKPVVLTWEKTDFPPELEPAIAIKGGKSASMLETKTLTVSQTSLVIITINKKQPPHRNEAAKPQTKSENKK